MNAIAHPEPCVRLRALNHVYGQGDHRRQVLFDNHLDLFPGEITILTGPSGSGKSTLLTLIGALRSVQSGEITVFGRSLAALGPRELVEARRSVGFIFQAHNLFDSLTATENVHLAVELAHPDRATRERLTAGILTQLGLGDRLDHRPGELSGGQRQRVAIARALVNRPRLVLADEPTAALDQDSGRDVVNLLKAHARDVGATILIVTHDNRILDVADRIVHMVDGRIVSNIAVQQAVATVELLRHCPVFDGQPAEMLAEFAERMQPQSFAPGETVFSKGDPGDRFYVIAFGQVEVLPEVAHSAPIFLGPGDFFGEAALLTGNPRNATIVARKPTRTVFLNAADFARALRRSRTLESQLREVYSRRV
jgi:putative ABC transport system ATP-binding protein